MDEELVHLAQRLQQARSVQEVFGSLLGPPTEQLALAHTIYRGLVKRVHPDRYSTSAERELAHHAFIALQQWWEIAQGLMGAGPAAPVTPELTVLQVGKRQYVVGEMFAQGDLANLYTCTCDERGASHAVCKVAVDPRDNDLLANEANMIRALRADHGRAKFHAYVPELYDSFTYKDGTDAVRQVNVLSYLSGLYSLKEVKTQYPNGVDAKDMAWMWRRILVALGFAHANHIIHGAVLPTHVLIHPEMHGLVLVDWTCAVSLADGVPGAFLPAISLEYVTWYPSEVVAKTPPRPATDIYMAAKCMIDIMGGDPLTGELPRSVPNALHHFFRGCCLPSVRAQPQEAWALLEEFDELIARLWGKRTFRPFAMKPKAS